MTAEFWVSISQYLVGIIMVLALLFALMESSRKYDKYRQWPYLILAFGYFFLLLWSLIRAMLLSTDSFTSLLNGLQLASLFLLAIGYTFQEKEIGTETTPLEPAPLPEEVLTEKETTPASTEKSQSKADKEKPTWAALLAADQEEAPLEEEPTSPSLKTLETIDVSENSAPAVDRVSVKTPEQTEQPAEPEVITPAPETPKKEKKKKVSNESTSVQDAEIDLSYLKSRTKKTKNVKETPAQPSDPLENANRDDLMNDLFPIEEEAAPLAGEESKLHTTATQLPGEHRETGPSKSTKKKSTDPGKNLAGLAFLGSQGDQLIQHWPQVLVAVFLVYILIQLIRHWRSKATPIIFFGFTLYLLVAAHDILSGLNILQLNNSIVLAVEALASICIGVASWIRIKGRVTHHFLAVVSVIYLVVLALTIGLASFIVKDVTSLQLLLILSTGTLIALLPIIHSLSYGNSSQPKVSEKAHE